MRKLIRLFIILFALLISFSAVADTLDELLVQRDTLLTQLSAVNEQIAQINKTSSPEGSLGKICDVFPDEVMALTVRDACGKFSIQQEVTAEELANVKSLEPAAGQKITNLMGIGYLTGLTSIRLDWYRGEFEEFPDEMKNCKKLMFIDVQSTGLKRLPDWIGDLTELYRLNISGNEIDYLPDSLCSLVKLGDLNIRSNKSITKLPENIGNLVSLKELDISYTGITTLPDSIYALDFRELKMEGLPIK